MSNLNTILQNFHFLRPLWLLGLIPVLLIAWKLWTLRNKAGQWQSLIPEHLLTHLTDGEDQPFSRIPALLALVAGLLAVIALSGPAWRQISTPVEKSRAPLVLVVDLSRSMLAADPQPNRLTRARQKLTDILRLRQDGLTALIAFAGGSHVVAPLTDDSATLVNLVRSLHPNIMPTEGSRPVEAIMQASDLLRQGAGQAGTILMLTDEIPTDQISAIKRALVGTGNVLSILGIGSEAGAPVPAENGGFIRDPSGAIVMAQLDRHTLQRTAQENGGSYRDISLDNSDIKSLIPEVSFTDETVRVDRTWDSWHDEGRWLVLLILPFAALTFRRGWLFSTLLFCFVLPPQNSYAFGWDDLWQTSDQQGQQLLDSDNPQAAAQKFDDQTWKAEALDRSGQHPEAARLFGQQNTPEGFYNQGNALARSGELDKALEAYDKALQARPDLEAAQKNRKIVEELKKQQQKQQGQGENQGGDGSGEQNQNSDQSDQSSDQNQGQQENQRPGQNDNPQRDNSSSQDQQQNSNNSQQSEQSEDKKTADVQKQGQNTAQQSKDEEQEQPPESDHSFVQEQEQQQDNTSPDSADTEAWLRRIPDDPGGLLRRKFEQEQQQRAPVRQGDKTW